MFNDEGEFHSQLLKLAGVTKVPLILTMSRLDATVTKSFFEPFKLLEIDYDYVNYRYQQMRPKDLLKSLQIIYLFEGLIGNLITNEPVTNESIIIPYANIMLSQLDSAYQ